MIEVKLNGREVKIEALTIGKSYEIEPLLEDLSERGKLKIVSTLTGFQEDELRGLNHIQFGQLWMACLDILNVGEIYKERISLNGIEYGIIPIETISVGEFADIDAISSELKGNLHIIMSILYRPITKELKGGRYEIEKYDYNECVRRSEEFKNMAVDLTKGATSFFLRFSQASSGIILQSLVKSLKKEMERTNLPKELKILIMSLISDLSEAFREDGMNFSILFQEKTLSKLNQLQNYKLEQPSTSWLSRLIGQKNKKKDLRIKNDNIDTNMA
jgi:hypothetical protein